MKLSKSLMKGLAISLISCGAWCSSTFAQELMPLLGSQELIPVTLNESPEKGKKPSSYYLVANTACKVNEDGKEATYLWICEAVNSVKNVKSDYRLLRLTDKVQQVCYLRSFSSKLLPYGYCFGAGRTLYRQNRIKDYNGLRDIANKYLAWSQTGAGEYSLATPEDQWRAITDNRASVWNFENVNRYSVSEYGCKNEMWFSLKSQTKTYLQNGERYYTTVVKIIRPERYYDYSKLKDLTEKDYTSVSLFRITKNLASGECLVECINSFYTTGELREMPNGLDNSVLKTVMQNKFKINL